MGYERYNSFGNAICNSCVTSPPPGLGDSALKLLVGAVTGNPSKAPENEEVLPLGLIFGVTSLVLLGVILFKLNC